MILFIFSQKAEKELLKLDKNTQKILLEKLSELKDADLFESHIKPVQDLLPTTHRIRIGNYRLLIEKNKDEVDILSI